MQVHSRIRNQVGPPLLSLRDQRRPLWIDAHGLKTHYLQRRTSIRLNLRIMLENQSGFTLEE
ncbi:hypothetical protein CR513_10950, partial [Mucuna pruriens]